MYGRRRLEPSATNCPNAFGRSFCSAPSFRTGSGSAPVCRDFVSRQCHLGGHSPEAPPLPIPNRAVKLRRADGTAQAGEQVAAVFFPSPFSVPFLFRKEDGEGEGFFVAVPFLFLPFPACFLFSFLPSLCFPPSSFSFPPARSPEGGRSVKNVAELQGRMEDCIFFQVFFSGMVQGDCMNAS